MKFKDGFTKKFWLSFHTKWNEHYKPEYEIFGDIKSLFIEVTDFPNQSAEIFWDKKGRIEKIKITPEGQERKFITDQQNWIKFLSKEVSAGKLLIQRKLKFSGSSAFVLKHGSVFEALADIALKTES